MNKLLYEALLKLFRLKTRIFLFIAKHNDGYFFFNIWVFKDFHEVCQLVAV